MANPMGLESSHDRGMWNAVSRGLMDTGGSAWFTCTPIAEQWINEFFLPVKMMKNQFEEGYSWDKKPECWIMTGSSYDNATLDRHEIDLFAKQLSESERASRIYGLPKNSQGLVYSEFDQEKHVQVELPHGWKDYDEPPDNYTIRVFIDPHPRAPARVEWFVKEIEMFLKSAHVFALHCHDSQHPRPRCNHWTAQRCCVESTKCSR